MSARYLLDTNICIYIANLIPVYALPETSGEH
jgi:predicted nucleic acid-binding protein